MEKYHTMSAVGSASRVGPQSFATASDGATTAIHIPMATATMGRYGTTVAGGVGSSRRGHSMSKSKSVGAVQRPPLDKSSTVQGSPSLNKSKSIGDVQGPPLNKKRSIGNVLGRSLSKAKSIGNVLGPSLNKAKSVSNVQGGPSQNKSNSSGNVLGAKPLNKARSIGNVQSRSQNVPRTVDNGLGGTSLDLSRSIGNVQAHSLNKSKTMGHVGRTNYKLSVDNRLPPNFGRVSSAGSCRQRERERRFSSSPCPGSFSSLQPSPLYLSRASLSSQTSQSSITSQVLDTAESLGISASLGILVEDAKNLHKKLLVLALDLDLDKVGLSDEVESVGSEGMEERLSRQAWREKSFSPFESEDSKGQPRPSVGSLVDELTEVEQQISGGRTESVSTSEKPSGGKRNITASTATLELDELMQNLSKFEASNQDQGADGNRKDNAQKGKAAMDDLSSMLTSLDQDMTTRHGVNTVAKGMCAACNKPILNKVVKALGRQWHPEHFTCACCDIELGSTTYYESNGRPYCEKDYNELYAPRCAYCNGPILDRVMRALDRTWHPEHFFCTLCGKHFGTEGFHQKDGKAFCRECYYEKFAPRCRRCDKAIMEGFITAINAQWHPECFSCKVCGVTFPRGNYFEHEGEPHCEIHYHASRGTLCNSCQKPVTGKCITAMGKKWHPEHFNCAFCLKLLNKGTFKEHRQNPYCHPCYIKLFG